ncbi:undecaprenyl diphosphate synthase [Clostridium tetanomorphum]|uniref:Isoprenyl transferase n=1 Tax=Clostridium tetanomorphum TaxID=1553 RepID=A0A923ECQ2_CLOTT|nr:isoprenyl transferase [Clostridium tetanomorphum]KAJ51557.1 undecaprenyl pyrophosphate synthase [Clostridium tetanomorphum DSM 665]MBC2398911.1 isoprenyl transferase [Clostridium tetanomorphum]MBP1865206.1 undecaprenyl diphosphate synthase [Clostridium tetanomorphum]NRS84655.1 undecaprenyl diphosphate synthase [Clostridium tetanomorphum]NRZ97870.1 undecaprenyl diphosphate synthase [Clostridium tetanomorphum]
MWKFFNDKKKKEENCLSLDMNNIPKHIGIIMDGNGRWAKERNLPRSMGHKAGVETIRDVVKECDKLGVKYLTLYAFSTENWKRPKDEVNALMRLLVEYLKKEVEELHENNVIVNTIGDILKLPQICQDELRSAYEKTKNNTGLQLNLALNYGGRNEIVRAIKLLYEDIKKGQINEEVIDENIISNYLYTAGMPDPDLIIRPSGEQRISNFLLWQSAYSEFWYSDIKWPDFNKEHLHKAIYDFQNRDRRYGGVK